MIIEKYGWIYHVEVSEYTPARQPPFAQTPDSPGYDDSGDAGCLSYEIVSITPSNKERSELIDILSDEDLDEIVEQRIKEA